MQKVWLVLGVWIAVWVEALAQPQGDLVLRFKPTFKGKDFRADSAYMLPSGETIRVSQWMFFVHGIGLATPAGVEVSAPGRRDSVFLCDMVSGFQHIRVHLPVGVYNELRFTVGVPRALNHQDPIYQSFPLRLQDSPMFWDWKQGYVFFKVEGSCETVPQKRFHLAIGDDYRATPIRLGDLFALRPLLTVSEGGVLEIEVEVALDMLFTSMEGEVYPFSTKGHFVVHQGKAVDELRRNLLQVFRVGKVGSKVDVRR